MHLGWLQGVHAVRTVTLMRASKINICQQDQPVVVSCVLNVFTPGSGVPSLLSKKKKNCESEVTCRVSQIQMELWRDGEMPQCFRVLATLPKEPCLVSTCTSCVTAACKFSPKGLVPCSHFLRHWTERHKWRQNPCTHKKKTNKKPQSLFLGREGGKMGMVLKAYL